MPRARLLRVRSARLPNQRRRQGEAGSRASEDRLSREAIMESGAAARSLLQAP